MLCYSVVGFVVYYPSEGCLFVISDSLDCDCEVCCFCELFKFLIRPLWLCCLPFRCSHGVPGGWLVVSPGPVGCVVEFWSHWSF